MNTKPIRDIAIIILYNKDKKILLQHRDENAERLPGYWAFFGGGIDVGETPEKAARREALEELNYELENPRLIMKQNFAGVYTKGVKYVFIEECNPSKNIVLGEGQGMGWFNISETKDLKIVDHDRIVMEYLKDKL